MMGNGEQELIPELGISPDAPGTVSFLGSMYGYESWTVKKAEH